MAGYFDGDGTVEVRLGAFTLAIALAWTDTYLPQLEQLRSFLLHQGIHVGSVRHVKGTNAGKLTIKEQESVVMATSSMLPHTFKKRRELEAAIKYLKNEIKAADAMELYNKAVEEGLRSGKIRHVNMPWTKEEGIQLAKSFAAEKAGQATRKLTHEEEEKIREDYKEFGFSISELAGLYAVSWQTISRVVKG